MEKMMKKPEVEAVRFDDADVIATSSLRVGQRYIASTPEAKAGGINVTVSDDTWVDFTSSSSGLVPSEKATATDDLTADQKAYYYAWYRDTGWYTDHQAWSNYNNKFPTE